MKIDRNRLVWPIITEPSETRGGIPLRLEIATRLLKGSLIHIPGHELMSGEIFRKALLAADCLIESHNETCEEEK